MVSMVEKIDEAAGMCHPPASFNSKTMNSWCKTALDHCLAPETTNQDEPKST
jgi:hypothetical protein